MKKLAIIAIGLVLTAAPALPGAASPSGAAQQPPAFAACAACHATEAGKSSYGPNLSGVAGRQAGSLPGYDYSDALKASGLTWDEHSLDKWLTSPKAAVPGTKMPFPGIADPAKRKQVVDYLLTLK
ncbi:cytochrome c [Altererythrobacter atlanticus]|uniref:Cytochrome c2 iso-2 n=1 Tax=Croceibacterium atlanticum TaxID=1267766 RepID=A0A0F7KUA1_9SPHN|nr:c-type cytochrome [Croceibacterium atlanticum]AKH42756.1 Cytochrome c2 iso-2 [Croceibacterium atlanticum]MBB5731537.1 cytochrome c [Croceibacterium atlanticum]